MTPTPQGLGSFTARPTFLVIGAMKCATSTICAYLEDHPDVFMVPQAEPNFFSHDENWMRGAAAYYAPFFDGAKGYAQRGEGSNAYANGARYPHCAARMAAFCPGLKLVYMVRDPLARIRSDWIQRRIDQGDSIPADLHAAVVQYPEIFVDQSLYWENLQRYRTHFSDQAIFLGFMEDMKADPDGFFGELTKFLNVPARLPVRKHLNDSADKRVPSPLYSRLNPLPGIAFAKRLLPVNLRTAVKREIFSRPASAVPDVATLLPRDVTERVIDDARAFLVHAGKPADFWRLPVAAVAK